MESILQLDQALFQFVHVDLSNGFFDFLLPIWRNKLTWLPFYVALLAFLLYKYKMQGLYIVLLTITTASLCDYTSSSILKPAFDRTRPCNTVSLQQIIIPRVDCGSGKSFPSSHATNHFGIAVFLILVFGKMKTRWKVMLLFWAGLIAFAQVYVGVHFPLDVLGGSLLGTLLAFFVYVFSKKLFPAVYQFDQIT
ncbi:MAG: phosphatase PAP2 family protein [Saprospiraceae bacterium]|nr:phosphatase PAP2 family protein [Saprospiraceae bacterium]